MPSERGSHPSADEQAGEHAEQQGEQRERAIKRGALPQTLP